MSEERVSYQVAHTLLQAQENNATLAPELRAHLEDVRRKTIALLISVDTVLGCEPSIMTRAKRRAR